MYLFQIIRGWPMFEKCDSIAVNCVAVIFCVGHDWLWGWINTFIVRLCPFSPPPQPSPGADRRERRLWPASVRRLHHCPASAVVAVFPLFLGTAIQALHDNLYPHLRTRKEEALHPLLRKKRQQTILACLVTSIELKCSAPPPLCLLFIRNHPSPHLWMLEEGTPHQCQYWLSISHEQKRAILECTS